MYMAVTNVVMMDMFNHLCSEDQPYFRKSREAMFKPMKLEEVGLHTAHALIYQNILLQSCVYCLSQLLMLLGPLSAAHASQSLLQSQPCLDQTCRRLLINACSDSDR